MDDKIKRKIIRRLNTLVSTLKKRNPKTKFFEQCGWHGYVNDVEVVKRIILLVNIDSKELNRSEYYDDCNYVWKKLNSQ